MIQENFYKICKEAKRTDKGIYLSLYKRMQVYGGPEEGGWWRNIVILEAYQEYNDREDAEKALHTIENNLIPKLDKQAQDIHGNKCLEQLESCDWDGETAQHIYGEVDGPDTFFVVIEESKGSHEHVDCAYYE